MDLLSLPVPTADRRLPYGPDPQQFGDLWLPGGSQGRHTPLVVLFHGGWWKGEYDLGYAGHLCAAMKQKGLACWSVEYRRLGETGGGWPTTLQDAGAGFDSIAKLATQFPIDLSRVITMGHSAGGQLAFWVAGRHHIGRNSPFFTPSSSIALKGAISLAGAVDLRLIVDLAGHGEFAHSRDRVFAFLGGSPGEHPDRYQAANPGDLLPLQMPQHLFQGSNDDQIPPDLPQRWASKARAAGDPVTVSVLPGADHFDVMDPRTEAGQRVVSAAHAMMGC